MRKKDVEVIDDIERVAENILTAMMKQKENHQRTREGGKYLNPHHQNFGRNQIKQVQQMMKTKVSIYLTINKNKIIYLFIVHFPNFIQIIL